MGQQIDPELIKETTLLSNAVEKAYDVFRARADGKELTENDVRDVLRKSTDSARRRAVWEASKAVGPIIEPNLKKLARLRNRAAGQLGFKDFHVMQLALSELDQKQVLKLFDELDALTRRPFHAAKAEIDAALARNCGVKVEELRPWHYHDPFFQDSPAIYGHYDAVYKPLDIIKLCRTFYAGTGLPIDDVLARSDLYEKPGKRPHAFRQDMDREGDVLRAGERGARRGMAGDDAARAGPFGLREEHSPQCALRLASRVAPADDGRARHDVRASWPKIRSGCGDGASTCRTPRGLPPR